MAYTYLGHTAKAGSQNSVTSDALDTTGADLLVVCVSTYVSAGAGTMSDSKGNSWTGLTVTPTGDPLLRMYYSVPSSVGAGHTFSFSATDCYASIAVQAFSGAHATPADQQNQAWTDSVSSQASGSITPSEDNCLIVSGFGTTYTSADETVSESMTITDRIATNGGVNYGIGMAYKIQTTATAINPSWAWTGTFNGAAKVASFKAAAALSGGYFLIGG